jgi:hypothetical protein
VRDDGTATTSGADPVVVGRRGLLGAVVVAALAAGCRDHAGAPAAAPTTPPPDPALAAALHRELTLLAAYDQAIASAPVLAGPLAALRADHASHRDALLAAGARRSAGVTAPATPTLPPPGPRRRAAVLRRLATAEQAASAAHAASCVSAARDVAPLLGSLAACEHAHGDALAAIGTGRP